MSAFYDIWIAAEGAKPHYSRKGNAEWKNKKDSLIWESRPVVNDKSITQNIETNTHYLIIIGQFYEPTDTIILLKKCIAYTNNTIATFNDPAGSYILFLIDKVEGSVYVFTDRFGTYHAYYSSEAGNKAVSTYFIGLAKQSLKKKLDWEGITGFLGMGYFPNDSTYFDSIKIFQPASCYSFDSNMGLKEYKRYWSWTYEPSERSISEYLDEIDSVLRFSLSFSLKNKRSALPISGGLDSRLLAGVIESLDNKNIWSYSYGFTTQSPEIAIARRIANNCHFAFDSYVIQDYLFKEMGNIVDSVELFQYVDGTRQISVKERLEENADIVVGGHWGDVWFSNTGVGDNGYSSLYAFRKKIIKKGSSLLLNIFADYIHDAQEQLDSYFTSYMNRYSDIEDEDFRFKIYKTDQWSFRWTLASIRAYSTAVTSVLPFYDKNVVTALTKIPTKLHSNRNVQIEHLKQHYPSLAAIRWQEYNSNLYNYKWINNRNLIHRGIKKIQRTVSPNRHIARNADVFYLHEEGRQKLEGILKTTNLLALIPERKIDSLLTNYYRDPSAANTYAVSMLHTFAQFVREVL